MAIVNRFNIKVIAGAGLFAAAIALSPDAAADPLMTGGYACIQGMAGDAPVAAGDPVAAGGPAAAGACSAALTDMAGVPFVAPGPVPAAAPVPIGAPVPIPGAPVPIPGAPVPIPGAPVTNPRRTGTDTGRTGTGTRRSGSGDTGRNSADCAWAGPGWCSRGWCGQCSHHWHVRGQGCADRSGASWRTGAWSAGSARSFGLCARRCALTLVLFQDGLGVRPRTRVRAVDALCGRRPHQLLFLHNDRVANVDRVVIPLCVLAAQAYAAVADIFKSQCWKGPRG
ncbi:Conserved exported protein of uncharacterised function%2C proline%2C glycine%2C valine-rich [Mycobacterium tuberculosis]|nr:Conserved exported protein of uncharacterised function%2C proline%2C glycine%2C valine-rich [Mycobacterium tuberculosis]